MSLGLGLYPTLVELPLTPDNHAPAGWAVERLFDHSRAGRAACVQFAAAWVRMLTRAAPPRRKGLRNAALSSFCCRVGCWIRA